MAIEAVRHDRVGERDLGGNGPQRARRPAATRWGGRAARSVVLAVVALSSWASLLPGLDAVPSAGAQVEPEPRALPAPAPVTITDSGYEPDSVSLAEGQTVVFTNGSAVDQTVTESTGLFDSGAIPPGGAFSLSLDEPGYHAFATTTEPAFAGYLTVGRLEIAGPPDQLVRAHLPEIAVPPVTDWDELPGRGIITSRTRIAVMFAEGTTVGAANAALADANVTIIGTTPALNAVVVTAEDRGAGDFDATFEAEESLRSDPVVEAAALDLAQTTATVPPFTQDDLLTGGPTGLTGWLYGDQREPNGSGKGQGGNWGLEQARFPQAWNVLDPVRRAAAPIDTLVLDLGFTPHDDLPIDTRALCYAGQCNGETSPGPTSTAPCSPEPHPSPSPWMERGA